MNYAIVFRLLSYILFCEAALLLLPATASLCYGEWSVLGVFVLTAALCLVLGLLLRRIKPSSKVFYMREGFATTALSWHVTAHAGAGAARCHRGYGGPVCRGRAESRGRHPG